jgi:ribosome-associated protein
MSNATPTSTVRDEEVEFVAIRAQGAGGQNVNKVSSAVHLRFDILGSSLPEAIKTRLLQMGDRRINSLGVVVIKAQRYRSLEQNREDALARLRDLVERAAETPPPRRPTKPTRGSQRRRVESKMKRGELKARRGRVLE